MLNKFSTFCQNKTGSIVESLHEQNVVVLFVYFVPKTTHPFVESLHVDEFLCLLELVPVILTLHLELFTHQRCCHPIEAGDVQNMDLNKSVMASHLEQKIFLMFKIF